MLIERDGQMSVLNDCVRQALTGQGRLVVVSGEAGIGKTTLLRGFSSQVPLGVSMHWGGCEALFTPRPLGPLQDMAHAIDPHVADLLDQTAKQDRIFPALLNSIQSSRHVRVLVFEDVHWADNATLDLIKYLGRRLAILPLVLVLSLRSDEIGVDHPLAQVLGDLPAAQTTRIGLDPLSPEGVETLARAAGTSVDGLFQVTAGNPFFVTELLAGGAGRNETMPASVRDAVWSRISRLTPKERELLELMSIMPGGVEPTLLRQLIGETADVSTDSCVSRGVLVLDHGLLKFRHELARKATLERLSPSTQKQMHARVDVAMSNATNWQLSRRVHHADGSGNGLRVLELAPQAAGQAAGLGAHMQAAAHLGTALKHVHVASTEQAAQLYEDWAYEAGLALKIDDTIIEARHNALALWRQLGRADKVGLNLRWLSRLHWYRGEAQLAKDYVDQAVKELEGSAPGPEMAMAYSALSQMHMLNNRLDEALLWGRRAIALAEELGEEETRAHALNNVAYTLMHSGQSGGEALMEESLALSLRRGFHEQAARAYTNYSSHALSSKQFALAERLTSEGIAFDIAHDLDSWTHYLIGTQAELLLRQGKLREAERIARGVLALKHQTLIMRLPALSVLAAVSARLGEDETPVLLQLALTDALATGELPRIVPVRLSLVEAAWLRGDVESCHVELKALAENAQDNFDPWELGEFACWWKRAGMAGAFRTDLEKMALPYAAEYRGDGEAAAQEWLRLGAPYEAALALLGVDGGTSKTALTQAAQLLDEIEAGPLAEITRKMAKEAGIVIPMPKQKRGPYSGTRSHPLGLTSREIQVLELLAQGFGNQEIARRLFRSPRTVEHHVSSVFGKFDAASRMDVVLRLRSEPWLLPETNA